MTDTYKLYGWQGSGSFAVQACLEEMAVPYTRIWVGREATELAQFRSKNPTGKVPALELPDGTIMFESAAMLIQLSINHPTAALAPSINTSRHAEFLQWMVFLSANVYEAVLRIYYPDRYSSRGATDAEAIRGQGIVDFYTHLALISQRLNPYVLGAEYSLADIYLYMLATWYPGQKAELYARLPRIEAHAKLIAARPAVKKVEADHAINNEEI